jgi:hypothetical protein
MAFQCTMAIGGNRLAQGRDAPISDSGAVLSHRAQVVAPAA